MLIFSKKKDQGRAASNLQLTVLEAAPDTGVSRGAVFPLDCGDNLIGRDAACEVIVKGATISRRHARVRVSYGRDQVVLTDLGSVNGTLVQPSTQLRGQSQTLRPGDEFQVGDVVLRLTVLEDDADEFTMVAVQGPEPGQ